MANVPRTCPESRGGGVRRTGTASNSHPQAGQTSHLDEEVAVDVWGLEELDELLHVAPELLLNIQLLVADVADDLKRRTGAREVEREEGGHG